MKGTELHDRLAAVAGGMTYRRLGDLTATNPETVRRYMQGQAPSVEFLAALCHALGVNAGWLLTGAGPMRQADQTADALKEANPAELLAAVANTLTALLERVERLEVFVQTLETRVRAHGDAHSGNGIAAGSAGEQEPKRHAEPAREQAREPAERDGARDVAGGHQPSGRADAGLGFKAQRIAAAAAQRPREDAG